MLDDMSATSGTPRRQRYIAELDAADGLVRRVVDIGGAVAELQLALRRHARIVPARIPGDVHAAIAARLGNRASDQCPVFDVVGRRARLLKFMGTRENCADAPPCRNRTL